MNINSEPIEKRVVRAWRECPRFEKQIYLAALIVGILLFGYELTNITLSIDDEHLIHADGTWADAYQTLKTGRPLMGLWTCSGTP